MLLDYTQAGIVCPTCAKDTGKLGGEVEKRIFEATPSVPIVCACGEMLDVEELARPLTLDICFTSWCPDVVREGVVRDLLQYPGIEAVIVRGEGET